MRAASIGRPGDPPSPRASRWSRVSAISVIVVAISSCSNGASEPDGPRDADVLIQGFRFQPPMLEIVPGTTVRFENVDEILHTATATDNSFDLELPDAGASATFTFTTPGSFAYACSRHPSMTGAIEVSGEGSASGAIGPRAWEPPHHGGATHGGHARALRVPS